jgi:sugar lactone lactonase YvrE
VVEDAHAGLRVAATRCHGQVAVSDLDHGDGRRRRWWHRPCAARPGMRVALRLAMLALCLLAPGCGGGDPELPVAACGVHQLPAEGGALPAPRAATAAPDGGATVLDTAGRVLDYASDGTLRRQWRMPEWSVGRPEGLTWLADGRLAVADTHYHRVVLFDRDGRHCGGFGGEGDAPGSFRYPVGICRDDAGRLYVSEYGGNDRIQVFSPDGTCLRTIGGFGTAPDRFQRPQSLCWSEGRLYVADTMNDRIVCWRDDGTLVGVLGGAHPPVLRFPYGVALLPDRTLLVAEYAASRLTRLDRDGRVLGRQGGPGRDAGGYETPWGLGIDRDGRAWICDTGNRRLQILTLAR